VAAPPSRGRRRRTLIGSGRRQSGHPSTSCSRGFGVASASSSRSILTDVVGCWVLVGVRGAALPCAVTTRTPTTRVWDLCRVKVHRCRAILLVCPEDTATRALQMRLADCCPGATPGSIRSGNARRRRASTPGGTQFRDPATGRGEGPWGMRVDLRSGSTFRSVNLSGGEEAALLLRFPFERWTVLHGYEAILDPGEQRIVAAVTLRGTSLSACLATDSG
jgi:hypothetical protein